MNDQPDDIGNIIRTVIDGQLFELVDFQIRKLRNKIIVDVVLDRLGGGITLGECARLNRDIADVLEKENVFDRNFVVEVSSPGLDRPLKTAKDFKRVVNKEVRFYLSEKVLDKLEHAGRILDADETHVFIKSKLVEIQIPLNKINKAVQVID